VIEGVTIARSSGELASHGRRAIHTVDGSGLAPRRAGWNRLGHPFYHEAVAYRQAYLVKKKTGRYSLQLNSWNGSVARVLVNGKPAGHIVSAPWECDITKSLRRGENTLEVQVVGTLKNLLGPHHAGRARGSAWPGMFQQGPADGPPAGAQYDTIAYGLFEPFAVRQALDQ
jgi:hypothetical protein